MRIHGFLLHLNCTLIFICQIFLVSCTYCWFNRTRMKFSRPENNLWIVKSTEDSIFKLVWKDCLDCFPSVCNISLNIQSIKIIKGKILVFPCVQTWDSFFLLVFCEKKRNIQVHSCSRKTFYPKLRNFSSL